MAKQLKCFLTFTLASLGLCAIQPEVQARQTCEQLKAVVSENWFPVSFAVPSDTSRISGIAVELLLQTARELSVELSFVRPLPWKRAQLWLEMGKVDLIIGHYSNQYREQNWLMSKALFTNDIRIFYPVKYQGIITRLADIEGLKGVVPAGASYGDRLDRKIRRLATTQEFKDNFAMLGAVLQGKFDFAVSALHDGQAHLARMGIQDQLTVSPFSLGANTVHFSFSERSPCQHLFSQFDKVANELATRQHIDELQQQSERLYFAEIERIP
ncbi:substrate-binding periplasmic protein [Lacimicrobium alkaliphilum]|nr:transporter substrate-binding domain-containing protein [Lacimicrobium alkaliphilum]